LFSVKVKKKMHTRRLSICFGLHQTAEAETTNEQWNNQIAESETCAAGVRNAQRRARPAMRGEVIMTELEAWDS
jgi:hypothetical protein